MQTRGTVWSFILDTENLRRQAETLGGASETVQKSKLNSSCEAEKKITVQKKELNLLNKNLIEKYDVIINK